MKKIFLIYSFCTSAIFTIAQNVGIGTTTPRAPFNVADTKTVLFGADTLGAGGKLIWFGTKSAFRAGVLLPTAANYWDNINVGTASFATGTNNKASGISATALGDQNTAGGTNSAAIGFANSTTRVNTIAIGYGNAALAEGAIAIGEISNAAGYFSKTFGSLVNARSAYETALGRYNTDYTPTSANGWSPADRLLSIGNGYADTTRSDALVILKNGNTGIGTSIPKATLNVGGGKTVLFGADTNGAGSKMIWYPTKSAFRTGLLDQPTTGNYWNSNNVGTGSFASGVNTQAVSWCSNSMGYFSQATGLISTALGESSIASGYASTAIGSQSNALGSFSTAIGRWSTASSGYETVVGSFNTDYTPASTTGYNADDRLFTIGNGTGSTAKSDALVVLKNGSTGIGLSTPGFPLNFAGTNGDKISLWGNIAGTGHYGFGIQPGLLQIHANTINDDVAFGYGSSNNFTERMRVKGNGNVGIGTNNPYTTLHVKSASSNPMIIEGGNQLYVTLTENGTNVGYLGSYAGNPTDVELGTYSGNTTGSVILSTNNTPKLTVANNGNVGIGLSNPAYKLHLGNSNNGLRIEGPAALGSGGSALNIGGQGDIIVDAPGVAGGRFIVKENGNTGIGNAAPGSKLQVDGALATKVNYYTVSGGTVTLDNTAAVWIFTVPGFSTALPDPATCQYRRYTIVNKSLAALPTSGYWNLTNANVSSIPASSSMELISSGGRWDQIK